MSLIKFANALHGAFITKITTSVIPDPQGRASRTVISIHYVKEGNMFVNRLDLNYDGECPVIELHLDLIRKFT